MLSGHSRAAPEKVIVFTGFRANLDRLAAAAAEAGMPAAKEEAIEAFRDELPVLVSTEAAGEGRNLQFCHAMVNFDLPWNPMQIEQRLGRLHRIGSDHDVVLTNLVCKHTIEERILRVLEAKLNLFELVVGELDMMLGRIDETSTSKRPSSTPTSPAGTTMISTSASKGSGTRCPAPGSTTRWGALGSPLPAPPGASTGRPAARPGPAWAAHVPVGARVDPVGRRVPPARLPLLRNRGTARRRSQLARLPVLSRLEAPPASLATSPG